MLSKLISYWINIEKFEYTSRYLYEGNDFYTLNVFWVENHPNISTTDLSMEYDRSVLLAIL